MKKDRLKILESKWSPVIYSLGISNIIKTFDQTEKQTFYESIEKCANIEVDTSNIGLLKKYLTELSELLIQQVSEIDDIDVNFNILESKYNPVIDEIVYKNTDGKWYTKKLFKDIKIKEVCKLLDLKKIIENTNIKYKIEKNDIFN